MSNCQFDFRHSDSWPLRVRNRLDFLTCRWRVTYPWKAFDKGYNFVLDLTLIKGWNTKLWASKVVKVPISGIGSPRRNDIWVQGPWPSTKNTIRGKVVASPKFGPWWILCVRVYPWFIHAPKVLQLCINQLVVWFVQAHVNNWPTCHSSQSSSQNSNMPFYL